MNLSILREHMVSDLLNPLGLKIFMLHRPFTINVVVNDAYRHSYSNSTALRRVYASILARICRCSKMMSPPYGRVFSNRRMSLEGEGAGGEEGSFRAKVFKNI